MSLNLPEFARARVLVIGDVMLDRYLHGATSRISPEAPVPVVHVGTEEERPGGAANVALNVAALGAKVTLIGVTGQDMEADRLDNRLEQKGVRCAFLRAAGLPTITKLRVISRQQQLIRLDFEQALSGFDKQAFLDGISSQLSDHNIVILSDYAKGTLSNAEEIIALCRNAGIPVVIDPKGTDFARYRHGTIMTPNLSEFEAVVGDCASDNDIEQRGFKLARELGLQALLITRGEQGMSLLSPGQPALHLPTHAREVFDVTGAGDTVISVLATTLACEVDLPNATRLANIAAGIVVGKLGTAAISESELRLALKRDQEHDLGVMSKDDLLAAIADAKARGEKIVMTNGCFDLLHAGHVSYLEHARQLGDRLIVAVNDDESVKRLKGSQRPIMPLDQRMAVLAGLSSVDWVVPFGEDTPEKLICDVLPHRLVKGGDYRPQDIAGYECVTENNGRVDVIPFVQGCSTSSILKKIKQLD